MLQPATPKLFFSLLLLYQLVAQSAVIIRTFASDRHYSHYTHYVRFLFFTGCRPSEAVGLKWKHITNSVIQFRESWEVLNAIFYVLVEGVRWRSLPGDFPPWQTVYTYFRNWRCIRDMAAYPR